MLGPNAQGECRAATVKLRVVNEQYSATQVLIWPIATFREGEFSGRLPLGGRHQSPKSHWCGMEARRKSAAAHSFGSQKFPIRQANVRAYWAFGIRITSLVEVPLETASWLPSGEKPNENIWSDWKAVNCLGAPPSSG